MPRGGFCIGVHTGRESGWIAALAVTLLPALLLGAEPMAVSSLPTIRGQFEIGKDGRLILLPIMLGDREFHCLLDTGASRSAFDVSLIAELGPERGGQLLKTPAGLRRAATYDWPRTLLGGQVVRSDRTVVSIDLENIRRATNENVFGVIGMDVLRHCCLQINFDEGLVHFRDALPPHEELGEKVSIEILNDGSPFIVASVAGNGLEHFLIDTGAQGNSLAADAFDELQERGCIRLGSSSASVSVGGETHGDRGRLSRLAIGPFVQAGLRFSRVNVSGLGLRYFSRFRVIFDFPGKAAYLRKGEHYRRPEPQATSGLVLNWIDGQIVVESVRQESPGESAGLRPGDVLVRINEKDAREYDQFALRKLLTTAGGRRVPLTVHRQNREFVIEVVLADD